MKIVLTTKEQFASLHEQIRPQASNVLRIAEWPLPRWYFIGDAMVVVADDLNLVDARLGLIETTMVELNNILNQEDSRWGIQL